MHQDVFGHGFISSLQETCIYQTRLVFHQLGITLYSNCQPLLDRLLDYYKSYAIDTLSSTELELYLIEYDTVGEDKEWLEVPREAGKSGKKEGYLDTVSGRFIKKFKTGMVFCQRVKQPVAIGPCLNNLAQMVNFVNNQFLNHYLRLAYRLGHASAFSVNGRVTAIAAGSGGGKSTLMLRCLERADRSFLTNDRILIQKQGHITRAIGVAKLPRVNPGTLLHSDRLCHILSEVRQSQLRQMSQSTLWTLEEKYDVQIEEEYGPGRVELEGELAHLVMLDWTLDSDMKTQLEPVSLSETPEIINGLRKRPGPFYQNNQGEFMDLNAMDSLEVYCHELEPVKVFRLTGKVDFDKAYDLLNDVDCL